MIVPVSIKSLKVLEHFYNTVNTAAEFEICLQNIETLLDICKEVGLKCKFRE
jgi:hypothetical protein